MLTGNKGEWSEIYTFFKLLAEKKVYSGDANLNRIEDLFYPLIKILREEKSGKFQYIVDNDIIIVVGNNEEIRVPESTFKYISENLFTSIRVSEGAFALPEIEEFMNSIHCKSLKAKSADKADIKIIIHDLRTGTQPLLGFSIKSKLGRPSTLFNANSDSTNFIYNIKGINNKVAEEINSLKRFKDKFDILRSNNAEIKYIKPVTNLFNNNLLYIDCCLPDIIGEVVFQYYSSSNSKISEIVNIISVDNPLKFDTSYNQDFYEHKVKRFLCDVALGFHSSKPWKGQYDATGGYLVVKENGEVICYHIYNKNQFEDYLYNNTSLDTPSTSRHNFGDIYKKDNQYFINLNLQIRFK